MSYYPHQQQEHYDRRNFNNISKRHHSDNVCNSPIKNRQLERKESNTSTIVSTKQQQVTSSSASSIAYRSYVSSSLSSLQGSSSAKRHERQQQLLKHNKLNDIETQSSRQHEQRKLKQRQFQQEQRKQQGRSLLLEKPSMSALQDCLEEEVMSSVSINAFISEPVPQHHSDRNNTSSMRSKSVDASFILNSNKRTGSIQSDTHSNGSSDHGKRNTVKSKDEYGNTELNKSATNAKQKVSVISRSSSCIPFGFKRLYTDPITSSSNANERNVRTTNRTDSMRILRRDSTVSSTTTTASTITNDVAGNATASHHDDHNIDINISSHAAVTYPVVNSNSVMQPQQQLEHKRRHGTFRSTSCTWFFYLQFSVYYTTNHCCMAFRHYVPVR